MAKPGIGSRSDPAGQFLGDNFDGYAPDLVAARAFGFVQGLVRCMHQRAGTRLIAHHGAGRADAVIRKDEVLRQLERTKWFLWHGNVFRATESLTDLLFEREGAQSELEDAGRPRHAVRKKRDRALTEFNG